MKIREANINDAKSIRAVHLQAFDSSEAQVVADLAVNLLEEHRRLKIISLVATEHDEIAGHVAFSPVFSESANEQVGYILAPLAVLPEFQKNKIGSMLVGRGLGAVSSTGSPIVFVYGDPDYYSRFGFKVELARDFLPPHPLQFPEGWLALKLDSDVLPEGGKLTCVSSLDDPDLW